MKKCFSLLVTVFFLSSCSLLTPKDPLEERFQVQTEVQAQELTGSIQINSRSLTSNATHILRTEDDEDYGLRSSQFALSRFEGKKVKVEVEPQQDGDDLVFEVKKIEEIVTETPEEEVKLKTYKDIENRFSFDYPKSWEILLANSVLYLRNDDTDYIKITRLNNKENANLSVFVRDSYSPVTVGDLVAYKVTRSDGLDFYFLGTGEVLKLSFTADISNEDREALEKDFFTILQSLKIFADIQKVTRCGGEKNLLCPEGFRCEMQKENSGICVDINNTTRENYEIWKANQETVTSVNETEKNTETSSFTTKPANIEGTAYSNSFMNFSLIYPKAWWFKSFGGDETSFLRIEFAKNEIENMGDGAIMLFVKHGARGKVLEKNNGTITIMIPRDDTTHFEITGSETFQPQIEMIASSLRSL